jgi:LL-diaminopimelate aminotransferase
MAQGSIHFKRLKGSYIFPIIEKKLEELKKDFPAAHVINMGIGDTSLPLAPSVAKAISSAVEEMSLTSYGYGPSAGYAFLREAVAKNEYANLEITPEEIFISDGINTDITGILDLFAPSCSIAIPTPSYPAYLNASILAGKENIHFMPCTEKTGFVPIPPDHPCDIIYLCSPHNPTGVAMDKERLLQFVEYAKKNHSIILFDNAYGAFVQSKNVPNSIFEIPGADKVCLEFRSFSKSAGFTGLRCSYLALPKKVQTIIENEPHSLHLLWDKRQSIRFNGVSYPIQKGASSCYLPEGKKETGLQVKHYMTLAKKLKDGLKKAGQTCFGGEDSPYIWWKTPDGLSSWEFFDLLLEKCQLLAIPGPGFGEGGEGYIRLSAFSTEEKTEKALERLQKLV